jgi:hypothetical protein
MGSLYKVNDTNHKSFTYYTCGPACLPELTDDALVKFLNKAWPYSSKVLGIGSLNDYATIYITSQEGGELVLEQKVYKRRDYLSTEASWGRVQESFLATN